MLATCFEFPANVRGVIADCGFTEAYAEMLYVLRGVGRWIPARFVLFWVNLATHLLAGYGLREADTRLSVAESRYPILFIHGTGDDFVPCEMTKENFAACTAEKECVLVEGRAARMQLCAGPCARRGGAADIFWNGIRKGRTDMTNQHEITKRMPLLNREGNLTEPGWARGLLWDYHRPDIRASGMRIKEWDYYFVSNGHIGLALTIADNGYMGLDSVSYLNFDEKWEITKSPMRLLPMGKTALPETSAAGSSEIARGGYALAFYHDDDGTRKLTFHMDKFRGKDAIEA